MTSVEELGEPLGGEDVEDAEEAAEVEAVPEPPPPPPKPEVGPPEPPPPPEPEGFWKDARWRLKLRTYEFARVNSDEGRQETLAIGGRLGFRSGRWKDRVRIGAAVYTSQRIHGPDDRDGLRMLRPRQVGVTTLGEAWLGVDLPEGVEVRLGRQTLDLPYLNRNDSRMIPNTFEGIRLFRRLDESRFRRFEVGHVFRMKPRGAGHFDPPSRVAGAALDRGITFLGAAFAPVEWLQFGGLNLTNWDVMNVFYAETRMTYTTPRGLGVQLALQYTDQRSIGDEATGSFATHQLGLRFATSFKDILFTAAWAITDDDQRIRNFWGGHPGFVSLMRSDFDRAGERAWLVGVSYDFARLGWDGWSGFIDVVHGTDGRDPTTGIRLHDEREVDVTLDYRPEGGILDGIWFRVRGAWHDTGGGRTGRDIRLIVNYDLPL